MNKYHIRIVLRLPNGQTYDRFIQADDRGNRSVFSFEEALGFIVLQMTRKEFVSAEVVKIA